MSRSHPSVHPLELETPQLTAAVAAAGARDGAQEAPVVGVLDLHRVSMRDIQGMPGTPAGLVLRLFQFGFAVVSLSVMSATNDFPSVTAFRYLVAALSLQSLWSLSLAILDIYALLVKRCLRNTTVVSFFTLGDGIMATLTFAAACASAGIVVLIGNDFNNCAQNHCSRFETATAMAFMSWFVVSPSFFLNFWSLASR